MSATADPSPGSEGAAPGENEHASRDPRRLRRAVVLVAVLGVAMVVGTYVAVRFIEPPDPDAFYDPPDPLPAGDPGMVLRTETFEPSVPDTKGWKVLHLTTDPDDVSIAVSTIIVAPADAAPGDDRPVVAWAHPTTGVAERCAPSLTGDGTGHIQGLADMVANGWIVAATDYPGLGTPGPHPYLVGQSEARSVVDSVRAARDLDIGAGSQFAVWGHSQGGQASMWTAQITKDYAPELVLVGTASAAPAIELARLLEADEGTVVGNMLLSFALVSWDEYYPDADMDAITTSAGAAMAIEAAKGCIETNAQVLLLAPMALGEHATFLTADPVDTEPWSTYIVDNAPAGPIDVPIFVAQGTGDTIVRPFTTQDALTQRCDAGETVQLTWYEGLTHVEVASASAPDAVVWMRDRFEGEPAPQNCDVVRDDPIPGSD